MPSLGDILAGRTFALDVEVLLLSSADGGIPNVTLILLFIPNFLAASYLSHRDICANPSLKAYFRMIQ
jgi:hypothetical protein